MPLPSKFHWLALYIQDYVYYAECHGRRKGGSEGALAFPLDFKLDTFLLAFQLKDVFSLRFEFVNKISPLLSPPGKIRYCPPWKKSLWIRHPWLLSISKSAFKCHDENCLRSCRVWRTIESFVLDLVILYNPCTLASNECPRKHSKTPPSQGMSAHIKLCGLPWRILFVFNREPASRFICHTLQRVCGRRPAELHTEHFHSSSRLTGKVSRLRVQKKLDRWKNASV